MRALVAWFVLVLSVAACGAPVTNLPPSQAVSQAPSAEASAPPATSRPRATPTSPPLAKTCSPTDQLADVYHPDRLQVVARCLRVSGIVEAVRTEADGDRHVLLALDPPFRHLLRPANQGEELGDLVVEPVCVGRVTQADAIATCAADRDPIRTLPTVGMHIWMEGRYVFDLDHGGWAELHPLYRWGRQP
jgi:hypothetical protein